MSLKSNVFFKLDYFGQFNYASRLMLILSRNISYSLTLASLHTNTCIMKIAAILLMLTGIFMIGAFGLFYLLGFAMSFDAPGSTTDPKGWAMRVGMFLPVVALIVVLIFAWLAYSSGNYKRSVILGSLFPISGIVVYGSMAIMSARSLKSYKETTAQQTEKWAEEERLYPTQKYLRSLDGGVDTIMVNPSGTVIFQQHTGPVIRYNGPIAVLNSARDTIVFYNNITVITPAELDQFVDEQGRKMTEVYSVK
jgi:hypothetical protein